MSALYKWHKAGPLTSPPSPLLAVHCLHFSLELPFAGGVGENLPKAVAFTSD